MIFFRRFSFVICIGLVIAYLYRNWFSKGLLTAPDFSYISPLQLLDLRDIPSAWSSLFGMGLGGSTVNILNLETYLHLGVRFLVFAMHIPWNAAYRILFFWPFLLVGSVSSFYFCHVILKQKAVSALGMLIYMTNTYVLMLAGGGQVGLMMAYAFSPLVLASFIKRRAPLFIFSTALLLLFDLRFSFLVAGIIALYTICMIPRKEWIPLIRWCAVPLLVIVGVHSFWIVPSVFGSGLALPEGYGSAGWLKFLSWAEFSKTLSLLHPNWPENIFGKTYFFSPEFLVLPVLAFSTLFFVPLTKRKEIHSYILFFSVLGLLGAFFAKGVNPPFGEINEWFFLHVPLFNGFRDPTKFYLLTVISYSMLIPLTIWNISHISWKRKSPSRDNASMALSILFVGLWLVTVRPLVTGDMNGTFQKINVPKAYDDFGKFAYSERSFGRTLAVPWKNRFVFQSENHPVVSARDIFGTSDIDTIAALFRESSTEMKLRQLAIRYVIVPDDFTNEIFLKDRSPDSALRSRIVSVLDSLPYLDKKKRFDGLDYYEFTKFTGHFFTILPNLESVTYAEHRINPVTYVVDLTTQQRPVDVIFSESFDPAWQLWAGETIVHPQKTSDGVTRFTIDSDKTGLLTVHNVNQRWVSTGYMATITALILVILWGYVRLCRTYRLGFRIHILLLALGTGVYIVSLPRDNFSHALSDKDILWSAQWSRLYNPILKKTFMVSHYGGAEVRFNVSNSKELAVRITSPNSESHIQGIDVIVDGSPHTRETPMYESELKVDTATSFEKPVDVLMRHWCAGTMGPCEVVLSDIQVDKGASIEVPDEKQKKTLAVLGDSISVSFGNLNYTYALAEKLGYRLHNAAIFGSMVVETQNWDWSLKRLEKDIIAYTPDVLLIFLGTNDLSHDKQVFRSNYSSMIKTIQEKSPNTKIITIGLLRRMDYPQAQIMDMSRIIRSIAQANGVSYVDVYSWLDASDFQDVVHPSPESQAKLADKMYQALLPILSR